MPPSPTKLVFVYFIGDTDVKGPSSRDEWETEIQTVHSVLGLTASPLSFATCL